MLSQTLFPRGSLFLSKLQARGISLAVTDRDFIQQALDMSRGNQVRAGRLLGISGDALHHRMKKLNSLGHCVICPTPWVILPIETQLNSFRTLSHRISKFPS